MNPDLFDGSLLRKEPFKKAEREPKPKPDRVQPKSRSKGLKRVSDRQAVRNAFLAGLKAERIANAIRTHGHVECSNCPKSYTGHSAAHQNLQLHHEVKRSRGHGYQPGKGAGVDEPGNLVMLCAACHREAEASEPMFSKESA